MNYYFICFITKLHEVPPIFINQFRSKKLALLVKLFQKRVLKSNRFAVEQNDIHLQLK